MEFITFNKVLIEVEEGSLSFWFCACVPASNKRSSATMVCCAIPLVGTLVGANFIFLSARHCVPCQEWKPNDEICLLLSRNSHSEIAWKQSALVHLGYNNETPETGCLIRNRNVCISQSSGSLRSEIGVPTRSSQGLFQVTDFFVSSHGGRG